MVKWCTKFRVFNVLLLFCLLNLLVFRQYFLGGLQTRRTGGAGLLHHNASTTVRDASRFVTRSLGGEAPDPRVVLVGLQHTTGLTHTAQRAGDSSHSSKSYSDVTHAKENPSVARNGSHDVTAGDVTKGVTEDRGVIDSRRRISDVIKDSEGKAVKKGRGRTDAGVKSVTSQQTSSGAANTSVALTPTRAVPPEARARALVAMETLVLPRAGVVAPWKKDNNTTPCPLVPPNLVGPLATYTEAPDFAEIVELNPGLEPGGHYRPPDCKARHRVAIILPYRDRELHLRVLLHNLHPMLIRQQLDYFILAVELELPTKFNRGMLLNIGAVEALGLWDVDCFILHDVDLVPENDRNLYTCPEMPRHMSAAVDKFRYKLPYSGIFGGVTALRKEHFFKINGYSNAYFGWGGEDDDLAGRVSGGGLKVTRYGMDVARYRMIKHGRDKKNEPNPRRFAMLNQWKKRQTIDGLNSLQYEVKKVEFRQGYTWMLVSVDKDAVLKSLRLKS